MRRRAERVIRPTRAKTRRLRVLVITVRSPRPIRAVQRARLCAITWTASQAPLAAKRPDDPRGSVPNNTWGFGLAKLPLLAPGAPLEVSAVAGDEEATVSWTASSADGGSETTTYTVSSSPESQATEVDGSTLSTVMTDLTNGISHTFNVTATNAIGTSVA